MAYSFNGTNQYLDTTSTPVTAVPISMSGIYKPNNATSNQNVVAICRTVSSTQRIDIIFVGQDPGDPVNAVAWGSSLGVASTTTSFVSGTYQNGVGIFSSDSSRTVYLNGGSSETNTTNSGPPSSLERIMIGAIQLEGSLGNYANGDIAEAAIWNVALTEAEAISLGKGFKPYRIRPQNLVFYAPLIRNIQDVKAGRALTNNNTATVANHPRVI